MAVDLQRLHVKLYLEDESSLSSELAFRVFNAWIPETTEEVLVDVADYTHVPLGPQTLLVGHDSNYALDNTDGRLGLLYGRKTPASGGTQDRLRDAFRAALRACRRLEEQADLAGKVRFRGEEALLLVNDRLRAPNSEETLKALRPELDAFLSGLWGGARTQVVRDEDPRQRFTLHLRAAGEFDVPSLLRNLGA